MKKRVTLNSNGQKSLFDEAVLEADGTMVETTDACKQGMDIRRSHV